MSKTHIRPIGYRQQIAKVISPDDRLIFRCYDALGWTVFNPIVWEDEVWMTAEEYLGDALINYGDVFYRTGYMDGWKRRRGRDNYVNGLVGFGDCSLNAHYYSLGYKDGFGDYQNKNEFDRD